MVASQAAVKQSASTIAIEMSAQMEVLASYGDWDQVEELAVRLRAAVMDVPENQRRNVIKAVQRHTDKVAEQARQARQDVTGKIHELRKGQAAKKAYELA